jgi:uncharacterized protein (TIGR00369 family)
VAELRRLIDEARAKGDYRRIVDLVPYGRLIGLDLAPGDNGNLLFRLSFKPGNIGNPLVPALHGGVIGGFMQHAALLQVLWNLDVEVLPKAVDFSIDYLRPARLETLHAECTVVRQGQRVANVAVTAWQGSPQRIVATARIHVLLSRPCEGAADAAEGGTTP